MNSIYYSSAYSEIWGNPDLKPYSHYELDLMWQFKRKYTVMAFARFNPDYSVQLPYQPTDRMVVIMKETNFNYSNSYGLEATAQFEAGKWLNGNVAATGFYRHDKSNNFFDLPFSRNAFTALLSATVSAKLSNRHNVRFVLNPSFQSKAIQGVYDIRPIFKLNASLHWTSDNSKWSLIASGSNLTNSYLKSRSLYSNQNFTLRMWQDHVSCSLTAIYKIGNFKDKKYKNIDTSRMGY